MTVIELADSDARRGFEWSLGAGQAVSAAVLARAMPDGRGARLWASKEVPPERVRAFEQGGVAGEAEATAWLVDEMDGMAARGARCLVVEDWLARPSDPGLRSSEIPVAFLGESVFAWCELPSASGPALPTMVIRAGGAYPTNAFVVSASASELGLSDGQEVPADFPQAVAASVMAVVVSIYDAETYLVWSPE
jgi:hypothetical protein